jgi:hypothetical protein
MGMRHFFLKDQLSEKEVIQHSGERRKMQPTQLVKNHPAETAGPLAMAIAALIANLADITDTDTIVYLALVLSFVPAVVTWVVNLKRGSVNGPIAKSE